VRKSLALILSAGILLSLAACSSTPDPGVDCSSVGPGDASNLVSANGDFGSTVTTTFPFPLVSSTAQSSVLIEGDGAPAGVGGLVNASYSVYDAETGDQVGSQSTTATVVSDKLFDGLKEALACASTGERVAVVLPKETAAQMNVGASGSVVMVFDILNAFQKAATGADQPAQSGFPSVVHDSTGRPGVSIAGEAPTEAKSTLLKKGDGQELAEGDQVIVQATAVSYATKKLVSSTWEDGSPQLWLVSDDTDATSGSKQPAGIAAFLQGVPVGSEVLVVLPDEAGSATAWVVDVLGILPAS